MNRISDERKATIAWMYREGRSILDIAFAVRRQPQAIRRWLKKHEKDLTVPPRRTVDPEMVRDLVGRGYNTTEIAHLLGFSREAVGKVRRKLGIQVSRAEGRKRLNPRKEA